MEMAEVLKRRRTELGMSQAELAAAAGVDTRQIRRYEAAKMRRARRLQEREAEAAHFAKQ